MERSDIELMLCAQKGDLPAFAELTRRYREPLRRFFAALLLDSAEADDCVQETFVRLWLLRHEYAPTGKFSTYLFQIGKHHLLNQKRKLRSQANHVSHVSVEAAHNVASPSEEQPEWIVLHRDRSARFWQAVTRLPPHLRVVVQMRIAQRSGYADIARELQIPVGTVKSRMAEARKRLRDALQEDVSQDHSGG